MNISKFKKGGTYTAVEELVNDLENKPTLWNSSLCELILATTGDRISKHNTSIIYFNCMPTA